jgi:hypothetical protein
MTAVHSSNINLKENENSTSVGIAQELQKINDYSSELHGTSNNFSGTEILAYKLFYKALRRLRQLTIPYGKLLRHWNRSRNLLLLSGHLTELRQETLVKSSSILTTSRLCISTWYLRSHTCGRRNHSSISGEPLPAWTAYPPATYKLISKKPLITSIQKNPQATISSLVKFSKFWLCQVWASYRSCVTHLYPFLLDFVMCFQIWGLWTEV